MNGPGAQTAAPKHAVILSHPDIESFCSSVAEQYRATVTELGQEVVVRDLYAIGFDPLLKSSERPERENFRLSEDVLRELKALDGASIFVLVYPIWFGGPPAILKGYVDRVFGAGFSYHDVGDRSSHPLLSGRRLISFTSSGHSWAWLNERAAWESLRNVFDLYLKQAFSFASAEHVHFASIETGLKDRFVREHLFQVEQTAKRICAELKYPSLRGTPRNSVRHR